MKTNLNDFTTENYEKMLRLAKDRYTFCGFWNYKSVTNPIILRHDIDFSVHRSLKLAEIEKECGVISTYNVFLHSLFYNVLEKEVTLLIKKIAACGHMIGLHFEPDYYDVPFGNMELLEKYIARDQSILSSLLDGREIRVFSFHNPDVGGNWHELPIDTICGMKNAYSKELMKQFKYCSDSNGYWRFDRLDDVLKGNYQKLYVLLHCAWYQDEAMPPRDRIVRCVDGRARKTMRIYDDVLEKAGRQNLR